MAEIQWGLLGGGQNALATGLQLGNQVRQQRQQNALMDLRRQELEQRQREAQAKQQQSQQEQRRADLPMVGRLLDYATDPQRYAQARAAAQQYGIDPAAIPEAYDPAWIDQQRAVVKALQDPAKMEALSSAGKMAMDMGLKPGTPEFSQRVQEIFVAQESKPYSVAGETRLSIPRLGGGAQVAGPQPGTIEDGYRFKGGNPGDPNSWEPVGQGGGGARVTSGFLDGL